MLAVSISPILRPAPRARFRSLFSGSGRHALWIGAWSIVGWVGTALAPALADQPFILMMLSPRALFVALASGSMSLVPFVLFGTLRLSVTDASYYIIGRRMPERLSKERRAPRYRITRAVRSGLQRIDRLGRWCCARPRLAGVFLFFRPNGKYLALAGAYGVQPLFAGLSAAVGTATFLAAMHVGAGFMF